MSIESDFFRSLLENFYDGVYFLDRERHITFWNGSAERISGFSAEEAVGTRCSDGLLMHVDDVGTRLCEGMCPAAMTIADGAVREAEVFLHHKRGHRVPVHVKVAPIRDPDGAIVGAIEVFSDNSAKMAALSRVQDLEKAAYVDALTGLANRALTDATLRSRLDELARNGWPFGVLYIDVDGFKSVNDRFGHDTGDRVLQMVAGTLAGAARSFDLIGRRGGDEFVAVLANVGREALAAVAERYRRLVGAAVLQLGSESAWVTLSIGGTLARPGDTVEAILARADAAMYESKRAGRDRVTIVDP